MLHIKKFKPDDLEEVSASIARLNIQTEHHIACCALHADEVADYLLEVHRLKPTRHFSYRKKESCWATAMAVWGH